MTRVKVPIDYAGLDDEDSPPTWEFRPSSPTEQIEWVGRLARSAASRSFKPLTNAVPERDIAKIQLYAAEVLHLDSKDCREWGDFLRLISRLAGHSPVFAAFKYEMDGRSLYSDFCIAMVEATRHLGVTLYREEIEAAAWHAHALERAAVVQKLEAMLRLPFAMLGAFVRRLPRILAAVLVLPLLAVGVILDEIDRRVRRHELYIIDSGVWARRARKQQPCLCSITSSPYSASRSQGCRSTIERGDEYVECFNPKLFQPGEVFCIPCARKVWVESYCTGKGFVEILREQQVARRAASSQTTSAPLPPAQ